MSQDVSFCLVLSLLSPSYSSCFCCLQDRMERDKRKRTRSHLTQDAVIWRMLSWVTPAHMLFFLRQGDFGSPKTCQMGYTNSYTIPLSGQTILLWLPLSSSFDGTHHENIVFWGCLTTSGSHLCWMLSWWISLSFLRGVH